MGVSCRSTHSLCDVRYGPWRCPVLKSDMQVLIRVRYAMSGTDRGSRRVPSRWIRSEWTTRSSQGTNPEPQTPKPICRMHTDCGCQS
eukprot:2600504-Rhodomonas_salina.2